MKTALIALGCVLLAVGGLWIGQGAGFVGGSFMTGRSTWLFAGIAAALLGAALLWWASIGHRRFP